MIFAKALIPFALAAVTFGGAAQASAAALVASASGPSAAQYTAGTVMAADRSIRLVAGDTLVLADGGRTRTLRGPGLFSASEARVQLAAQLIDLDPKSHPRAALAAVRGTKRDVGAMSVELN